ncbi:hypothetical protein CEP54_012290 [Fusarium duplospermum]|uniref:Uncharacterized protein n=1 Tax=Fusarium duplospermum TaxID=1325734 RepID=A0A428P9I7_9HYPO|nr:hypothetical protein CEP54_012290 [Fusarium duplospermum]
MTPTLWPSTWIQALPIRLKCILGAQQPSSTGSNQASTPNNPMKDAANLNDEWEDWVIPTPEGVEQVKKDVTPLVEEPEEDGIRMLRLAFEELLARQRIMVGQREEFGDLDQKPSDGEREDDLFHLKEIPAGIRMPCHTPPDSDVTRDIGPCILDLGMGGGRWQTEPGKSQARKAQHPLIVGNTAGSFWYLENDNVEAWDG